ncbi:MAG: GNAT family N-acetyltransferase [Patescibacteria group bacterium]|jgi:ribosomal-protein-alanine N-acetyltransferase
MPKVTIRKQKVSDAKRFYEILNNPNFIYFRICPKSIEAERKILQKHAKQNKKSLNQHFAIMYDTKMVGGCGIKINPDNKQCGEIGYFLDEAYWGRGITTKAVKQLEKIGFKKMKLVRIEIKMNTKNSGSQKVAIKCGYKKEGIMRKAARRGDELHDAYLYAKVV